MSAAPKVDHAVRSAPRILESFTGDYTGIIHHAQRADGAWFQRFQERHPRFGYRFGAWKRTSCGPDYGRDTGSTARLPKDG